MFPSNQPYTFDRVVRLLITALVVLGILFLIRSLSSVLTPFFIAVFNKKIKINTPRFNVNPEITIFKLSNEEPA